MATIDVFFFVGWNLKCLVSNHNCHRRPVSRASISANVTFSLCHLEEVIDMGAETYPQACERWGQAACKDFVCLFGSWTSWALGLLWGNSRAKSHFAEAGSQSLFFFALIVSSMQLVLLVHVWQPWFLLRCQSRQCKGLIFVMVVMFFLFSVGGFLFLTWIGKSATDGS